jgi:hypothetical protein
MEQQTSHWITLATALTGGLIILLFSLRPKKARRSFGQWVILTLYKVVRFFWAIVRATDVAYLEYRRTLQEIPLDVENERSLGKIVKSEVADETDVTAMHWIRLPIERQQLAIVRAGAQIGWRSLCPD